MPAAELPNRLMVTSITIENELPLSGDYNNNGVVDAADYVVWRKNEGTTNTLLNDSIGGMVGPAQYDQWRAHFGQTTGNGTQSNTTVPEPACALLLLPVVAAGAWWRRYVARGI